MCVSVCVRVSVCLCRRVCACLSVCLFLFESLGLCVTEGTMYKCLRNYFSLTVSGFVSPLVAVSRPKLRYSGVPNEQEREGGFINSRVFQKPFSIHYFDFGKLKPSFSPLNSDLRVGALLTRNTLLTNY